MPAALFPRAFVRRDDDKRGISAGGAGDHVLEEFLMAWRIDDHVVPRRRPKLNLGRIDGDVLLLFFRQRIEDKRVFELPALRLTARAERFDLPFRKRAGFFQKLPDQGRFAVIDMADKNDLHMKPFARSFCIACGS